MNSYNRSKRLYAKANKVMPGGVSSPVRAFGSVGGSPLFIARGKGQHIWDVDGNRFTDYVCSWGALILGHANNVVTRSVYNAVKCGSSFGAPTESEVDLARRIRSRLSSINKIRFVNSGTEATMSAIRLARAYTKRSKVIKFEGCYHGHADSFLSGSGSGLATLGIASSPGVPASFASETISVPYNDTNALESAFAKHDKCIAAVIVEPIAGNMGVVPPMRGFLDSIRKLCTDNGSILVFDEVITGFRVSMGGAQKLYHIKPDLTCLGKIIGGGFPIGAYGGSKEIMDMVAPSGPVYQAGTLAGNPAAMAGGIATLSSLHPNTYALLERLASRLGRGLRDAAEDSDVPVVINRVGSMMSVFFNSDQVSDFVTSKMSDTSSFKEFFWRMLAYGTYMPPSQFESFFVSTSHHTDDIDTSIEHAYDAMRLCRTASIRRHHA
jgi:glutamate-1-semialdehyde 2,1-aminomutase